MTTTILSLVLLLKNAAGGVVHFVANLKRIPLRLYLSCAYSLSLLFNVIPLYADVGDEWVQGDGFRITISDDDYESLMAFYRATGGDSWSRFDDVINYWKDGQTRLGGRWHRRGF